jgi:Kdo2-lipid IVA lauroyltransferase/acyltransferase
MKFLLYPVIYGIAIIPFPWVYGFSHLIYFILRYLVAYRKEIIENNLEQAFPEKSKTEIRKIRNKFYRNYSEIFIETLKILSVSQKNLQKRISFVENEAYTSLFKTKGKALILTGHIGNFELAGQIMGNKFQVPVYAAYKPLKDKFFDKIVYKIRSKNKTQYIAKDQVLRKVLENMKEGIRVIFLNDQNPTWGDKHHWVHFLNKDALFFTAPAKIAVKFNIPVYFFNMYRIKRGHYIIETHLITKTPLEENEESIIEKYAYKLEEIIRERPENWLWSHRRWKHVKEK